MFRLIVLTAIFLLVFNLAYSLAVEISEEQLRQEEELLLLGEEFVITAAKHPQEIKKAPAIVTLITAEQIKHMGARNLMDVLRIVPGLGIYTARYGQGEIAVRGIRTSGSEKVRVMIDGHGINEYFMGSAMTLHDDIEVDNIKRVEVIRGPGAALYGENAFSAVINIITKDAQDTNGTEIKAGWATFDTEKYNVTFGKTADKFEIAGAITHLETDAPKLKVEEYFFGNSGRTNFWKEKLDLNLKLAYLGLVTQDDKLMFNTKYTRRERTDYIGLLGALNDETSMDLYQFFGELSYHHTIGKKTRLTYKAYYDQFDEDIIFEVAPGYYIAPRMTNRTIGFDGELNYELFSGNNLTAGFMLEHRKQYDIELKVGADISMLEVDPGNWNNDGDTRDIWALYLQDEWYITPAVNLTLGVRHDHYSDFGNTTNPRVGLVWQFMEDASLKLLHGWAFRAPNSREMFDRNNPNTAGNKDLQPEKIKTTEVELRYRFTPRIEGGVTYFYNYIQDIIVEDLNPSGSPTLYTFHNKGGAKVHGVELDIKAILAPTTYVWANYSYQHTKDKETGNRLPDVPSQKLIGGLNVGLWRHLNANAYVIAESKFIRINGDSRDDLPGYATLNLTLIAKEFFQTFEIRGSIYNLLDKDYKYSSPLGGVPSDYPQVGREYMLEVSYKF